MTTPRSSLRSFLSHAKQALHAAVHHPRQKVTIVVGNESAEKDLDSLTSSLLYAYLRSADPPKQHSFTPLYIPLLNIPAADLRLRPEFSELFQHADIRAQDLVTLDDLPSLETIEQALRPEDTRWILVDHNKLQGTLGSVYWSRVRGVIDHHDDEVSVPQVTDPEPRVIEKCGSCTSLVVRTLRSSWDTISRSTSSDSSQTQAESPSNDNSKAAKIWDAQLAETALASILIDTGNLSAKGKAEAADTEAVEYLESKILTSTKETTGPAWDRTQFYNSLQTAKQNIDFLNLNDILRKDYKQWPSKANPSTILGISSVIKPLSFLTAKAAQETPDAEKEKEKAFDRAIQTFMQDRHLSLFAIMTHFSTPDSGRRHRELLLKASSSSTSFDLSSDTSPPTIAASAASRFAIQFRAELGLEPLQIPGITSNNSVSIDDDHDDNDGDDRADGGRTNNPQVWTQTKLNMSRKQVAPLLREAMG